MICLLKIYLGKNKEKIVLSNTCFRLTVEEIEELDKIVAVRGYANRAEAVREAVFQLLSDEGIVVSPDLICIDRAELMSLAYNK